MISHINEQAMLSYDGHHRCPTYGGQTIGCRIRIIENRWNTIVIATDLSDSIYSSITLHTEELAETVRDRFNILFERMLWIEHIPTRFELGRDEDLYDLVHFDMKDGYPVHPFWTPLTEEEVMILTDGLLLQGESVE